MRLLTVGSLPPEWGGPVRGGAATFHAALLEGLLAREDDVEVVGVLPPGPLDREIPVPAWIRPEDVGRASFYEDLLDRLRPDLVLMNHIAHTIGATHARLGSPAPAVGVIQSWHNVTFSSGEECRRALALTQEALSGLGAMVAVSHHTATEGRRLGFEYPPTVETIHNPVPPLYMEEGVDVQGDERAGVSYLGSLIPRKAPDALVEATALSPNLGVVLAGQGELKDELRAQIDALGIGDRVRLAEPPPGGGHLACPCRPLGPAAAARGDARGPRAGQGGGPLRRPLLESRHAGGQPVSAAEREEARALLAESFDGHKLWGWKDPRNSLTLPFWQRLLPGMCYVVCLRNPLDIAASLERRDGMPIDHGLELWRTYVSAALAGTAGRLRLLVSYESFFADRNGTAERLAHFVGRAGAFDSDEGERRLAEAVDERLWRQRNGR